MEGGAGAPPERVERGGFTKLKRAAMEGGAGAPPETRKGVASADEVHGRNGGGSRGSPGAS